MHNKLSARYIGVSVLAVAAAFAAKPASAGLVITPVWDSSITGDANAAAIQGDINSVISLYQSTFTDNITVKVYFQEGGGLGSSITGFYQDAYAGTGHFKDLLTADSKTADDAAAITQLNANPYTGANVIFSSANGRALGYNAPGFVQPNSSQPSDFDGQIILNTSLCFFTHNSPVSGKADLFAVTAHELDEVLGTVSGLGFSPASQTAADLFRYNGSGARSFTSDTTQHAFFSIDGSTNIVEYNQFGRSGGDWGDWKVNSPAQVQDWAATNGVTINPSNELRLLDVVGYDRAPVPEPASMAALGIGVLALLRRRRK